MAGPQETAAKDVLEHEHTVDAIAKRLGGVNNHSALGDFVLGAVDGTITTFAIVAGVAGAQLAAGIAVVLGLANVLADGFSMAVGNFLKTRADHQVLDRYRQIEERHIQQTPEGEREEIRQIFSAKGFEGEILEEIVSVITADRTRWVETMLTEEWGLQTSPGSPWRAGLITFVAFLSAGMVPLAPLFLSGWLTPEQTFLTSAVATVVTFAVIGAIRGYVTNQSMAYTSLEIVVVGGFAALLAFLVGSLLRQYVG